MRRILRLIPTLLLVACDVEAPQPEDSPVEEPARIETLAGDNSAEPGFADGTLRESRFNMPEGLAWDEKRGLLYVADSLNHVLRAVDVEGDRVTTIAGVGTIAGATDTPTSGGPAMLNQPRNLVLSADGDTLFFTDTGNFVIRSIDLDSHIVTTRWGTTGVPGAADGVGTEARFGAGAFLPWGGGLAFDAADPDRPVLYVADSANQTIRVIDVTSDEVTTLAGIADVAGHRDGAVAEALFNKPAGLSLIEQTLYVAEANNIDLRAVDLVTGIVSTVAGKPPSDPNAFCENVALSLPPECGHVDGASGIEARFRFPFGLSSDGAAALFIVDSHNNLIRRFDVDTTEVTTVAGLQATVLDDIPRPSVDSSDTEPGTFSHPTNAVLAGPKTLYVADRSANCLRKATLAD